MKKFIKYFSIVLFLTAVMTSCHDTPDYPDDLYGNFDALSEIVGNHYCFFEEKHVDWSKVSAEYRKKIEPGMTVVEFFNLLSEMLDELKDGHVNLSAPFSTSYYAKWWTDYPQDFNLRTLQQYYLDFDYFQTSGISYKILEDNIGYMYYPSFSYAISDLNLDYIMAIFYQCDALIIDIRDNGGGMLTNVGTLVSRFIEKETTGGYIIHKTGPGPKDFSEPYRYSYKPAESGRVTWSPKKPIYVLTNRSCFSAANDFTSVMKSLPNVKIVGAKTGGGGGLPFSSELPNGWAIRFSASPILAPDGSITEFGIEPSVDCECHSSDEELAAGKDAILDFALEMANNAKK